MTRGGRAPSIVIAVALLLAMLVSGGSAIFPVLVWLGYRAWQRDVLKSCILRGCVTLIVLLSAIFVLSLIVVRLGYDDRLIEKATS